MRRAGFTLIELLVVLMIIGIASAAVIPAVVHTYGEQSIQEAARLVQASIVAARDEATRVNAPRGIRFLPDPVAANASNRLIPMEPAPDYSEGIVGIFSTETYSTAVTGGLPVLVLERYPIERWITDPVSKKSVPMPAPETSWWNNVRVGDRLRISNSGPWMTVCGPTTTATSEGFVSASSLLSRDYTSPDGSTTVTFQVEYLLLTNGLDDDGNGFIDDGYDGVDNNVNGVIDELAEWEAERWPTPAVLGASYVIRRRPVPGKPNRIVDLPASILIDLTDTPAEFMVDATGAVSPSGPYAVPTAAATFTDASGVRQLRHEYRIHLIERGAGPTSEEAWITVNIRTGQVEAQVGRVDPLLGTP